MQANVTGLRIVLLGAAMMASGIAGTSTAQAKTHPASRDHASRPATLVHVRGLAAPEFRSGFKRIRIGGHGLKSAWIGGGRFQSFAQTQSLAQPESFSQATSTGDIAADVAPQTTSYGGMSCVPFARANSGIELAGNAWAWWSNAAGIYERGSRPEVGSVLNFRSNGRMRSGHVAVVTNVDDPRTVEVDHANWSGRGAISRNVTVIDVSAANDWSAVRVALGRGAEFGSVYPTYGFIYDRPDHGTLVANTGAAPMPLLANAAPRDLRPAAEQLGSDDPVEVADAEPRVSYRRASRHEGRHEGRYEGRHGSDLRELIHHVTASAAPLPGHHGGRKHLRG